MNDTTQNLLDIFSALEPWSPTRVFWRLYYDDQGFPLFYTQEDKPGNYIDVDPEVYARASMKVRVKAGKLRELNQNPIKKKTPSNTGTPCHPCDVAIVVTSDQPAQHWRTVTNDAD